MTVETQPDLVAWLSAAPVRVDCARCDGIGTEWEQRQENPCRDCDDGWVRVTVCDGCGQRACWEGIVYCDGHKVADVKEIPAGVLTVRPVEMLRFEQAIKDAIWEDVTTMEQRLAYVRDRVRVVRLGCTGDDCSCPPTKAGQSCHCETLRDECDRLGIPCEERS